MHRPALASSILIAEPFQYSPPLQPLVLEPGQRPLSSANMSALVFALVTLVAVIVLGNIIFGGNGPTPPPRSAYYSTQESSGPPPSYTRRRPATGAHSHTASITSSTLSDELASVEDAEKLREEARRRRLEMTEAYNRAKTAQQKGRRGAAQEHKQRGDAHKSSMEDLDRRAAKIIFREKNKVCSYMSLDMYSRLFSNSTCLRIVRRA